MAIQLQTPVTFVLKNTTSANANPRATAVSRCCLFLSLIFAVFAYCPNANSAVMSFRFEIESPLTNVDAPESTPQLTIHLQFTLSDPDGQAQRDATLIASGKTNLSYEARLNAVKWQLWRSRFPRAQQEAEALVKDTGTNHIGALISLTIAQICRGEFESACSTLELLNQKGGPEIGQYWHVYLKSAVLGKAQMVEATALGFIESGAFNRNATARAAVLATCLALQDGRKLFNALRSRIEFSVLAESATEQKAYSWLLSKYGKLTN